VNQLSSVVALLGRPDSPTDGVADYCRFLRRALERRGVDFKIVHAPAVEENWFRCLSQLWRMSAEWRAKWVLLQYTALAWSRHGFPFQAVATILLMRARGVRCGVIFHEPFRQGGDTNLTWKDAIRGRCQEWVIRTLYRFSQLKIFTIPLDSIKWLPKDPKNSVFIPLGPNLPEYVVAAGEMRARNATMTVAVFCVSESPYREREVDEISHAMRAASAAVHDLRIIFVGKGTREAQDEIARAFSAIPVEVSNLGLRSLEDVSRVLAESDATLCVRGKLNLRRGSALAGIASAIPVIGYSGAAEWPLLAAGIEFVPFGDKEALGAALTRVLTDTTHRQHLREKNLLVLQKYLSWDSIAVSFIRALNG
jgi:glycosyltransferase involved in cell wall biosynthesis